MEVDTRYKHPKIYNLVSSPIRKNDGEEIHPHEQFFYDKQIIVFPFQNQEIISIYSDYVHGTYLEEHRNGHLSDEVKQLQYEIGYNIPDGWRICGVLDHEDNFQVFTVWNDENVCIDWDDTLEWVDLLDLDEPKTLYEGRFHTPTVRDLEQKTELTSSGFLIRDKSDFEYPDTFDYAHEMVKWVSE